MKRDLIKELNGWKTDPLRKPLIMKGARQVGKSWLVREFGKSFESFVEINFEKDKDTKQFFEGNINIDNLLEKLSLFSGTTITPSKTLLFLDEIQECENAISYLRYFKEEKPELHVIAAGSLIDFSLEKIGTPVGRVQFLHLYPISFGEYLTALGKNQLRNHLILNIKEPIMHVELLNILKDYMWLGGMPAVIKTWLDFKNASTCQKLQDEIINAYRQDFEKYAKKRQVEHVATVFDAIPTELGKKFKFSNIDRELKSTTIKDALNLLVKAHIAHIAYHSSGQGLPLGATKNEKKFKVFFFDIGLAQRMLGLDLKSWVVTPVKTTNIGAIAEQLVAQELISYNLHTSKTELYYWHREEPSSNAEVDLLWVKSGMVVPIEIKSGSQGGMKSMHFFLNSHPNSTYGVKFSERSYSINNNIREFPLYGIEAFVKEPN